MAPARADAKGRARATSRGASNVIIPGFSSHRRTPNEAGIRHEVRRNIEPGFRGTLLVSEAGTTSFYLGRNPNRP